jgi:hypothetical protein
VNSDNSRRSVCDQRFARFWIDIPCLWINVAEDWLNPLAQQSMGGGDKGK